MRRDVGAWIAVVMGATCWTSGPAHAINIEQKMVNGQSVALVSDRFKYGDDERFKAALARMGRVDEVWFSSPGGNVMAALGIGRYLRQRGYATRVPQGASCASACAYAFIGGVFRAVDPKARVGVHNSSLSGNDELLENVSELIRKQGAAGALQVVIMVEKAAARLAAEQGRFLLEMSVSSDLMRPITNTDPREMHWLSRKELVRYNVVNE